MPFLSQINDDSLFIPVGELEHGCVYEIVSRNLYVGVWDSQANNGGGGFIGIRQKFGDSYLFTEYEHTTGGNFGTARAFKKLDVKLPKGIVIGIDVEFLDKTNGRLIEFTSPRPPYGTGRGWVYSDAKEEVPTDNVLRVQNKPLFDILYQLDKEISVCREAEWQAELSRYRKQSPVEGTKNGSFNSD